MQLLRLYILDGIIFPILRVGCDSLAWHMNLYAGLEGAKVASPSCHVVKYQQWQLLCMCQHFLACKLLLKSKELEYPSLSLQVRTSIIRQLQLKKSNQFLLYSIPSYMVSIDSSDISESSEIIHPLIKK